jgi:tungstate transport system substrate-binding protein
MHKKFTLLSLVVLIILAAACQSTPAQPTTIPVVESTSTMPAPVVKDLILATTTSTQDSGLLDVLIPAFQDATGYVVKVVAVGSGEAMKMGEQGNADVLLVHSPAAEVTYMENGYGSERTLVMHNDFVIVGPEADPAGIKGTATAVEAFTKISETQSPFISRGDNSGTQKAELAIWSKAGITPEGDWYQESGQGMGATLRIVAEKGAYTLSDRATYLANKDTLALEILVEGDASLLNIYHVIIVNPDKYPNLNTEGAKAFASFLVSKDGQDIIGKFGTEKFGQPLFTPDAGKSEDELGTK